MRHGPLLGLIEDRAGGTEGKNDAPALGQAPSLAYKIGIPPRARKANRTGCP
jgi:hypothetical protein